MKNHFLPKGNSAFAVAFASIELAAVVRKQHGCALLPVMVVSCVPAATYTTPRRCARADRASPTLDATSPTIASTLSCSTSFVTLGTAIAGDAAVSAWMLWILRPRTPPRAFHSSIQTFMPSDWLPPL